MKVIVKVGRASELRLRNVQAMRAINFGDVADLMSQHTDVGAIIVEDIRDTDQSKAEAVLAEAKQKGLPVFFYNASPSTVVQSAASSIGVEINSDMYELQRAISKEIAVNVVTAWGKIRATEEERYTAKHKTDNTGGLADVLQLLDRTNQSPHIINAGVSSEVPDKSQAELAELLASVMRERDESRDSLRQANDRIDLLRGIQTNLEAELTTCKGLLADVALGGQLNPDEYSPEYYARLASQFNTLREHRVQLEQNIAEYEATIKLHSDQAAELEEKVQKLEAKVAELESNNSNLTNELTTASEDKSGLQSELEVAKSDLESARASLAEALEKQGSIDSEAADSLKAEAESLAAKVTELSQQLDEALTDNNELGTKLQGSESAYNSMANAYEEKVLRISELEALVENLEGSLESSRVESQQISDKLASVSEKLDEVSKGGNSELEAATLEFQAKTSELEREIEELRSRLDSESQAKLSILTERDKANAELSELRTTCYGLKAQLEQTDVEGVTRMNSELRATKVQLETRVGYLEKEVAEAADKYRKLTKAKADADAELTRLRTNIQSMQSASNTYGGAAKLVVNCDYSGKGLVIPVFGSGSYGITTTAMSLAHGIAQASILYMDMDIVNPKADAWFGKQPLVKDLPGVRNPLMRSSFGALLENGTRFVLEHERELFIPALEAGKNHGSVDYFSGAYTTVDPAKLLSVDFSTLMNFCGNKYDYIIVDLGHFGSSDVVNALVRMFDSIAYRSIVVTLNDKFDTRNISVKVGAEHLDMANAIWVLNIADSTAISPMVKKAIGQATPVIIPKEPKLYGTNKVFGAVSSLKDRARELVNMITE